MDALKKVQFLLEQQKKETRALQDKVSDCEEREKEYAQTLLCVNRAWEQLVRDVGTLCSSAGIGTGNGAAGADGEPSTSGRDTPSVPANISDPYLRALLKGADATTIKTVNDSWKRVDGDLVDVEQQLMGRASSVKSQLAQLLSHVQQLRAGAAPEPPDAVKLQQQVANQAAVQRMLQDHLQLADDRLLEAREQIKKLQNELADMEQELTNAQRKLFSMKNEGSTGADGAGAGPSAPDAAGVGGGGGGGSNKGTPAPCGVPEEVLEELQQLQQSLARRTQELEAEREAHMKAQRELREAQAKTSEESSWVQHTRMYANACAEVSKLQDMLAAKTREVDAAAAAKDAAEARASEKVACALREQQAVARIAELNHRLAALAAQKAEADRARGEAEAALVRERERAAGTPTLVELQALVGQLQAQLEMKAQEVKLAKAPAERVASAVQEVAAARGALACKEAEVTRLRTQLASRASELAEAKAREAAARESLRDLQVFVDVLSVYCPMGGEQAVRDAAAAKVSEAAAIARADALQAQLEGHELRARVAEVEGRLAAVQREAEAAAATADAAKGELVTALTRAEELGVQLSQARAECELYIGEIEATASAYEDASAQNARLLSSLVGKDDAVSAERAERAKVVQAAARLEEALEAAKGDAERLAREVADAGAMREVAERELSRLGGELLQLREQLRATGARVTALEQEVRRRDEAAAHLSSQLEASVRAAAQGREALAEAEERAHREKAKRQRAEEDSKALGVRLEKLRKTSGGGASAGGMMARELGEEVEAMRKLLNCNVCHERQKNVIITKCCHVFCDRCINRRIEARNRKCPGCGAAFGQADVKQFFFT